MNGIGYGVVRDASCALIKVEGIMSITLDYIGKTVVVGGKGDVAV